MRGEISQDHTPPPASPDPPICQAGRSSLIYIYRKDLWDGEKRVEAAGIGAAWRQRETRSARELFKAAIILGTAITHAHLILWWCSRVSTRDSPALLSNPQSGMMERGCVLFYLPCIKENSPRHLGELA